jgi:hypothetical protein
MRMFYSSHLNDFGFVLDPHSSPYAALHTSHHHRRTQGYMNRVKVHKMRGDFQLAHADLTRVLELKSDHKEAQAEVHSFSMRTVSISFSSIVSHR